MVKFNDLKGLLSEIKNIIKKADWEIDISMIIYEDEIAFTFNSIQDWYFISYRNNNITLVPPEGYTELSVEETKALCEIIKILDANKELLDI